MPRKLRFQIPGLPSHLVQRGTNRQDVFLDEEDYQTYLAWLAEGGRKYDVAIHAYVLMRDHLHLLLTPQHEDSLGRLMQYMGQHYVHYFNRKYRRSGSLWEGRYKASLVQEHVFLLACYRHIERGPVRAEVVDAPRKYRWSSFCCNALGDPDPLVTPHPRYLALARSKARRQAAYLALTNQPLDEDLANEIDAAWRTGTPLGTAEFKATLEVLLGCTVGQSKIGRPRKEPVMMEQD